jgi:ACS family sodium-dependent inorganic phosphate cotransporter
MASAFQTTRACSRVRENTGPTKPARSKRSHVSLFVSASHLNRIHRRSSIGEGDARADDADCTESAANLQEGFTVQRTEDSLFGYSVRLSPQYKVVLATAFAFVVGNMDKINISVAIIPMAKDFHWSPTVIGLVQSSFFYGYLVSQLPAGYASSRFGGKSVLSVGVGLWSLSTACIPIAASTIPGLFLSRAVVGLGEGVAPAAATDIIAKTTPASSRSRATSFVFGGLHVGSLLGLTLAPFFIDVWGWQSVFYVFGIGGLLWNVWWQRIMKDEKVRELMREDAAPAIEGDIDKDELPWRAFVRNGPVRALCLVHFVHNWFHYTMLAWLPSYFIDSMSLPLSSAAKISLLPPIAALIVSGIAGPSADALISRGVSTATVRKGAQSAAFLGPAGCLFGASVIDDQPLASMALVTLSLGLSSFSLAGLYCNHADLSPKYAPVLIGATNTAGALPGIIGVVFVGYIYDKTESWALSLFAPSIVLFILGTLVFSIFGSATPQNFERKNRNVPFVWEERVLQLLGQTKKT